MIEAQEIKKSYGTLQVLKGINFSAKSSEVVCIVGASGAGKSSLLQILGTLSVPDTGKVMLDGTDVFSLKSDDLADFRNKKIGFVFQFHHLLPEFTALENVMLPALIAKRAKKEAKEKSLELLNYLGLSERVDHKPSELSGGEQQRVAIARALVNNPSILLADEPSGNLDTETKKDIHKLFFDLRDKFGLTVIIVTHDNELAKMSDRTLTMKDGEFLV